MMRSFVDDDRRTVDYFTTRVELFGESVEATDWGSRASQITRFEVLAGLGFQNDHSLLDVGCGQGELFGWLAARGLEPNYIGIDITPAMIGIARSRFPSARFEVMSASDAIKMGEMDFVVVSGIFYLRQHRPFDYLCETISGLYSLCQQGLAFNCLSSAFSVADGSEYRESPVKVFQFCRTLTPLVALRHDYHPGDFTIYMRKVRLGK